MVIIKYETYFHNHKVNSGIFFFFFNFSTFINLDFNFQKKKKTEVNSDGTKQVLKNYFKRFVISINYQKRYDEYIFNI